MAVLLNPQSAILIVGQGLAGTALAWQLWERAVPFVIADPNEPETSSKIAAGLVTPITGRRLNLSWRIFELLPEAKSFYERVERELGVKFYHSLPTVRLLNDEREVNWWGERSSRGELLPFLEAPPPSPLISEDCFHAELGGFVQKHSGWLDAPGYLKASRAFFQKANRLRDIHVEESELALHEEAVHWQGETFSALVFCRGWKEQTDQSRFSWLNFDSSRGVIASVRAELPENRIINRGCWMLPKGSDEWRAGSTYEFDFSRTLEESIADLQGKLTGLLRTPFEILDAQRGVRPIVKQRQLILGRHPAHDRLCVFNGLGSKGVLRAPFFARMLVAHLLDGAPLEPSVDVRSND